MIFLHGFDQGQNTRLIAEYPATPSCREDQMILINRITAALVTHCTRNHVPHLSQAAFVDTQSINVLRENP